MSQMKPNLSGAGTSGTGTAQLPGSVTGPESSDRQGFERVKHAAASTLHTAAEALRQRSEGTAGQLSLVPDYGRHAADWLDRSADFVGQLDLQRAQHQVEDAVRRNPTRALLIATAAGLVVGTLIRSRR